MRFLVPAASAALIAAVTLSAPAGRLPAADTRSAHAGAQEPAISNAAAPPRTTTLSGTHSGTLSGADTAAATTGRGEPRASFVWPLAPRPTVVRRFDPPKKQWAPGHRGVDLSAAVGQPVLSAGEGVVAFSGRVAGGGVIVVRHAGGLRTTYGPVDERLASGTVVHRGARIGVVSPVSGHCAPLTCLHWGAIVDRASQQTYQDPLSLLGIGRPTLLPLG